MQLATTSTWIVCRKEIHGPHCNTDSTRVILSRGTIANSATGTEELLAAFA